MDEPLVYIVSLVHSKFLADIFVKHSFCCSLISLKDSWVKAKMRIQKRFHCQIVVERRVSRHIQKQKLDMEALKMCGAVEST